MILAEILLVLTKMTRVSRKIWDWLHTCACRYDRTKAKMEIQNGVIVFAFGLWLFFVDTFSSCPHSYKVLLSVARQEILGIVFASIGIANIVMTERGTVWLRKWTLLLQGGIWVFIFCAAVISDWRAPGVPIYFVLACSAFYSFLCLRGSYTE